MRQTADRLRDTVWRAGVRLAHFEKRGRVPASVQGAVERLGLLIVPAPDHDLIASLEAGIRLTVPPAGFSRSYAAGVYEEDVTRLIKRLARAGMRFVDVGAFCGYYTLLVAKLVGSAGHVYAFEADPDNHACLIGNVRRNGTTNVTATQAAILDTVDRASLVRERYRDRHWISPGSPSGTSVRVDATTLDTFFGSAGWPPVQLVKLDIEGAEPAALRGMGELCWRNTDLKIILEYHEANLRRRRSSPGLLWSGLCELGFTCGHVIEDYMRPFAIHPGLTGMRTACNLLLTRG